MPSTTGSKEENNTDYSVTQKPQNKGGNSISGQLSRMGIISF